MKDMAVELKEGDKKLVLDMNDDKLMEGVNLRIEPPRIEKI